MDIEDKQKIKEAWLRIAYLYRSDFPGEPITSCGLCHAISCLFGSGEINFLHKTHMLNQLHMWMFKKGYKRGIAGRIGLSGTYCSAEPIGCNFDSKLYRALVAEELAAQIKL